MQTCGIRRPVLTAHIHWMFYRKDKEDLEETEDNEIYLLGSGFLHRVVGKEVWNLWDDNFQVLKAQTWD